VKILTALGLSAALLLSALAGAVIVGNATAEESKTYYACADKKTGVLRLVKLKTKCKAGETRVVWGDVTPTPTPTPTPRPIPRSTPAPTVTCDVSGSGVLPLTENTHHVGLSRCAIPWSGLSKIIWDVSVTTDVTPRTLTLSDGDGSYNQEYREVVFTLMLEDSGNPDCIALLGCQNIFGQTVLMSASEIPDQCPASGTCTVTVSSGSVMGNQVNDKVFLYLLGIPGNTYSVTGSMVITKE
jgi:hypothetical protein